MIIILEPIGRVHSPFRNKQDIKTEKFATRMDFDQIEGTPILDIKPYTRARPERRNRNRLAFR